MQLVTMIEEARSLNRINREVQKERLGRVSLMAWLREFATIRLSLGRNAGHTLAICALAHEGDGVLTRYDYTLPTRAGVSVMRCGVDTPGVSIFPRYATVWVDDTRTYEQEEIDRMYRAFGKDSQQTFIFLG